MSKSKNRRLPQNAIPEVSGFSGTHLRDSFAMQDTIIFGFKHLDLGRGKFTCKDGHGSALLKVLSCFCHFSNYNQLQIGTTKNYHLLDEPMIRKNGFEDIVSISKSGKLFQMGKKQNAERIVGFFESNPSNLFQVCILDLFHQVNPTN